jgi:hypothetical protein
MATSLLASKIALNRSRLPSVKLVARNLFNLLLIASANSSCATRASGIRSFGAFDLLPVK